MLHGELLPSNETIFKLSKETILDYRLCKNIDFLDCKKYATWGTIVTILLVVVPLVVGVRVLQIMRRNKRKIRDLQKELAKKEQGRVLIF